jgi:hypothetical protein
MTLSLFRETLSNHPFPFTSCRDVKGNEWARVAPSSEEDV